MQIRTTKTGRKIKLYQSEITALRSAQKTCSELGLFGDAYAADAVRLLTKVLAERDPPVTKTPLFDAPKAATSDLQEAVL